MNNKKRIIQIEKKEHFEFCNPLEFEDNLNFENDMERMHVDYYLFFLTFFFLGNNEIYRLPEQSEIEEVLDYIIPKIIDFTEENNGEIEGVFMYDKLFIQQNNFQMKSGIVVYESAFLSAISLYFLDYTMICSRNNNTKLVVNIFKEIIILRALLKVNLENTDNINGKIVSEFVNKTFFLKESVLINNMEKLILHEKIKGGQTTAAYWKKEKEKLYKIWKEFPEEIKKNNKLSLNALCSKYTGLSHRTLANYIREWRKNT